MLWSLPPPHLGSRDVITSSHERETAAAEARWKGNEGRFDRLFAALLRSGHTAAEASEAIYKCYGAEFGEFLFKFERQAEAERKEEAERQALGQPSARRKPRAKRQPRA